MQTWNPADYHKHSSQQQKWARELIAKLQLTGDEHVLDIGSGDGKVTAELARNVPRGSVVGLDASKPMVEFAQQTFTPESHRNLRFVHGDASRLEFDQQFDLIFSNATLHWIYDHPPILQGIHRALRPGGRMLAQMGGKGCADDVRAVLDQMMSAERWREYFVNFAFRHGFHGPVEYRRWLADAGLEAVRVDHFPKDMTHIGAEGLKGWLRTTWMPYLHAIPEPLRDEFLDELTLRFLETSPLDAQGLAHVKMVRLEVEALRAVK